MLKVRVASQVLLMGLSFVLFGAIGLPQAQTRLYFPRVVNTATERTGIAIANLELQATPGIRHAAGGAVRSHGSLRFDNNPILILGGLQDSAFSRGGDRRRR